MADRKVRYILEVDYEGESVSTQAVDDLRAVDEAATQAGEGLERAEGSSSLLTNAMVGLNQGLELAGKGFEAVQAVASAAYEQLLRGAELSQQQQQFESLAASIGTTADALEVDLARATQGLQTHSEMLAGATQLMNLGLAKSRDEVIALSEVSGQLGWDIQVLGLTLANQSTARLDSLGLSIESVTSKVDEFTAAGMGADEAFKWAIIEAGREKIEILGNTADTTAGKIKILTNAFEDAQDAAALAFAEGLADELGLAAENAGSLGDNLEYSARGLGGLAAVLAAVPVKSLAALGMKEELAQLDEQIQAMGGAGGFGDQAYLNDRILHFMNSVEVYTVALAEARAELERLDDANRRTEARYLDMAAIKIPVVATPEEIAAAEWLARATEWVADANERAAREAYAATQAMAERAAADEEAAAAAERQATQLELAGSAYQAWANYAQEATTRGGSYFQTAIDAGGATWDLNAAIYDSAVAYGAGIGPLGELGVELGQFNEKLRDAAVDQATQQGVIDSLTRAAAEGKLPWDQLAESVNNALDVLEGKTRTVQVKPVEMPHGLLQLPEGVTLEDLQRTEIEIPITANNLAVRTAVDEVTGMLEGFTDPDTVYEAVMTLDIIDVENKTGEVQALLDGLPEQKEITINVKARGMELLDELRSMGVLP